MDNILYVELPPDLQHNIVKANKAGVTPKTIARYLDLPLSQVKRALAQDALQRREAQELAQWSALIGHNSSSA
jgi:hypothetical protein